MHTQPPPIRPLAMVTRSPGHSEPRPFNVGKKKRFLASRIEKAINYARAKCALCALLYYYYYCPVTLHMTRAIRSAPNPAYAVSDKINASGGTNE